MSNKLLPGAFRVWDSLLNEYVGEYPEFSISRNGVLMQNSDYEPDAPADSSRYIVERFTGLYDADDMPIFDGDVLLSKHGNNYVLEHCSSINNWIIVRADDGERSGVLCWACKSLNIVGTIHELEAKL